MLDYWALKSAEKACAVLYAFDLLTLYSKDIRRTSLVYEGSAGGIVADPLGGLRISEIFEGDGRDLFRHACAIGLEGIVSKRRDTPYYSGRFDGWRKIKCRNYHRTE